MILKPIGNPLPTASACGLCLPLASGAPWPAHRAGWSPGLLLFPGAALNQGWVGLLDKHSSPLGYLRGIPHHLPDLLGRRELLSPTLLTCPFPPLLHVLLTVQFSSVAQLCPTLCDPMNRSMPGLPVHHQFPEFTQTHVHWVGDPIQPSHPLSSPSPPALNLS